MKQMNLIPDEVKQKRKITEYKKMGAYASLLPIAVMAQGYLSIAIMKGNIEELEGNITSARTLEQQIQTEQQLIERNRSIIINLTNGGLPLNQFLLYTGVNVPGDVRLYSIASESTYLDEEKEESEENGQTTEEVATTDATNSTETAGTEVTEESPTEEITVEEKKNNIIIKGAALNVDSIGTFMSNLEKKNEYITNVDISDVQNYYNGAFNYKLFEIVIELNN